MIAYIYFTRIGIDLLEANVPYYMLWLGPRCTEFTTLVFFVVTGAAFKPSLLNPYLTVPQDEDPDDNIRNALELTDSSSNSNSNGNSNSGNDGSKKGKADVEGGGLQEQTEENFAADTEYGLNMKTLTAMKK